MGARTLPPMLCALAVASWFCMLFVFLVEDSPVLSPGFAGAPFRIPQSGRSQHSRIARSGGSTAKEGIFSPVVYGAKLALGDAELNRLRGEIIKAHTAAINAAVATSDSSFGQWALANMFELADADGNGTLDKKEIQIALTLLGFEWLDDEKKVNAIVTKADEDGNEVIDIDEFIKYAPKTLRQNLVKLAKKNGNSLGFLV